MVVNLNLIIILILYSKSAICKEVKTDKAACDDDIRDMENKTVKLEEYCKNKFCLPKCCAGANFIILENKTGEYCVDKNHVTNLNVTNVNHLQMNLDMYMRNNKGKQEEIRKRSGYTFVHNRKIGQKDCPTMTNDNKDKISILEDSSILIESPNEKTKTPKDQIDLKDYCIEFKVKQSMIMDKPQIIFKWIKNKIIPEKPLCADDLQEFNGKLLNISECAHKSCIAKCCKGEDRFFYGFINKTVKCKEKSFIEGKANKTIDIDYTKVTIFKNNYEKNIEISNKSLDKYRFFLNKKLSKLICSSGISLEPMHNYHILENNSLILEKPNYYNRFLRTWNMGDFCIEHVIRETAVGVEEPFVVFRYDSTIAIQDTDTSSSHEVLKSTAMLISCFFLILVLFVYGAIRELQNIVGLVMMAYVATLLVTFLLKAVEYLGLSRGTIMTTDVCKPMSVILYFTTLSTFFWMNIMSFDIWWTFRGMLNSRPIHRRGELVKFGWYALYAWGVPFLVTIAVGVIDYVDLSHRPDFYKPHFELCFYVNKVVTEMRHYLYFPISILVITDWFFFLLTAFNIWLKKKNISKFSDAKKYNNNQNRFGVYIKLALLMGVSWILELMDLPDWLQLAASLYNGLVGVAIFFLFVFKKSILFKLCKR